MRVQHLLNTAAIATVFLTLVSCSKKWDEFKQYTAKGETLYTGKVDSVKVYSGRLRVRLTGLLPADPKIVKCKISWNDNRDSVVFPISKGGGIEMLDKTFGADEGVKNFSIQTFDAAGNGSVVTQATGAVYGPVYESGLVNRPITNAQLMNSGNAVVTWDNFDTLSGAKGTIINYTDKNNNPVSVATPLSLSTTTLNNFKAGASFGYRTVYLPNANCIDTFYSAVQMSGVKYDVTASYINNAGPNFTNSDGGTGRWRTPAVWTTTPDVRNGGNNIGGIDAGGWLPGPSLSMEAGWGLPAVPNGKIYQTVTLPAGRYSFEVVTGDISDAGTKYVSVAAGTNLPDVGNVPATALVYKSLAKFATNVISFQLAAPTQVSIGFNGNLPNTGTFFKVFSVKLYSLP